MAGRPKVSDRMRREVIQRDGLYCRYCGHGPMMVRWGCTPSGRVRLFNHWDSLDDREIHLDHIEPLSRGGAHTADNLTVSCDDCNARKFNKRRRPALPPAPLTLLPAPSPEQLGWVHPFVRDMRRRAA